MKNLEISNVANGCIKTQVCPDIFAHDDFERECEYYEKNQPRFDTTVSIYDDELDCVIAQKRFEGYDIVLKRSKYEALKMDYFLLKEWAISKEVK